MRNLNILLASAVLVAGTAVADGAALIDLGGMRAVRPDPEAGLATAGGGALLADLDRATVPLGLACPTGVVSRTGFGGLALGGGYGWLCRKWGMTCDHIVAAEVVLADGTIVRADDRTEPELMWGLRGGGGNFGVVTRFTVRLRPVGRIVRHVLTYPLDDAAEALRAYGRLGAHTDRELQVLGGLKIADGAPVLGLTAVWLGAGDGRTDPDLSALLAAAPAGRTTREMSFGDLQAASDDSEPSGWRYYTKSRYLDALGEPVLEALRTAVKENPSPLSTIDLGHLLGAIGDVAEDATAFPERSASFMVSASAAWREPAGDEANIAWARDTIGSLGRWSRPGNYVNYMERAEPAVVARLYGSARYARMAALKAAVDPGNVLRGNQNVLPSFSVASASDEEPT